LDIPAIVEYDISALEQNLTEAWAAYQKTEKYGLEFGQACYELRNIHKSNPGASNKGKGFLPILEQNSIPTSTAYWWMERYEISIGKKAPKDTSIASSGRQQEREAAAEKLAEEDLFPAYRTDITPAVVSDAPDGIGYNITFKDLTPERAHQLANMPTKVPTGVKSLIEINKTHFDAVFAGLPAKVVNERITKLENLLQKQYGGG
jgi:hypothetical protein